MARGIARFDLFADDVDRRRFVRTMAWLFRESGTRCLAWALMSNHYHVLVETGAAPILRWADRV